MERCNAHASARSIFDSMLDFWVDWQVELLMILIMSLQCFLVLAGFFRKHTSVPALHACVWVAFLTLDACAMYALGLMLASGCDFAFSLYAPLALFHLGASDAINAYAPTDNDLWLRYGFKMALETIAAAYIVSRSSDCPKITTAAILLFVVGVYKYAERIYALRSGSQACILAAARPVYKYMSLASDHPDLSLLVSGDQEWYQLYLNKKELQGPNEKVTFKDIVRCKSLLKLTGHDIVEQVCLAYALFKVFRRRLTNLRIHQKNEDFQTVRNILLKLNSDQVRKVIDLELSFIFDGVFSKASAGRCYQGIGVVTRLFSLFLLFASAIAVIRLDKIQCSEYSEGPFAMDLANILVFVALVIECLQLWKIVRSNWSRVWLSCSYIKQGRLANAVDRDPSAGNSMGGINKGHNAGRWKRLHAFNQKAITCAFGYVGRPKSTHWNYRLGQLSILVESLNLVRRHYFVKLEIESLCEVQSFQLEITNLFAVVDADELQKQLVNKIIERYNELVSFRDICHLRDEITAKIAGIPFDPVAGLEDVVLKCHLLTSFLELNILNVGNFQEILKDKYVRMSIGLSRYCLHLMIRRPKLMPEDPDVAKGLIMVVKQQLKTLLLKNSKKQSIRTAWLEVDTDVEKDWNVLPFARQVKYNTRVAGQTENPKWKLLAQVWLDILIYIINTAENAYPHTEQMGKGGELLTHFWVLLGHLGPRQMDVSCA
ncbi:hypothetical protein L7F22_007484 [Adiantum nelumboides]|nr:hypothetical protein [Adiantum nelumboides]